MSTTDDTTPTNDSSDSTPTGSAAPAAPRRRRAASRPAGPPPDLPESTDAASVPDDAGTPDVAAATAAPAKPARKRAARKTAATAPVAEPAVETAVEPLVAEPTTPARRRSTRAATEPSIDLFSPNLDAPEQPTDAAPAETAPAPRRRRKTAPPSFSAPDAVVATKDGADSDATVRPAMLMFQAPEAPAPTRRRARGAAAAPVVPEIADPDVDLVDVIVDDPDPDADDLLDGADVVDLAEAAAAEEADSDEDGPRRRRRRGGRGRRRRSGEGPEDAGTDTESDELLESADESSDEAPEALAEDSEDAEGNSSRRRRRRRRGGNGGEDGSSDDPPQTVTRVRQPRAPRGTGTGVDEITSVKGSTRLEAKKQRRREGRDAGRRRPSILTEAEFLARREAVERVMVVRQLTDRIQIAVLEDGVLVEHYVNRNTGASMIGNVYLGKVQNVLPSMEAAFVDIGRGRNAVLYAGEVNWDAAGLDGQPRRIESALKSGDSVLVQVSKDPIGHKGARLTSQISLPGRFLVYVPEGQMTGISRKLPDTERTRLKAILRQVVPEDAGVIVRTAAEGATEDELTRDVIRLASQWEEIAHRARSSAANTPELLYGEPDLAIKVVRDIFNEDFTKLIVSGDDAWKTLEEYVNGVAPDLHDRLEKWTSQEDPFHVYRVDEQLTKALDRKVWLPSGGSLVIDRTEAMTVVDVNTGKFIGSGGNLEETVTKNNLEAAEEIVRQLRLRDIGGIIVVDFIDMVLENNRDLVLRRMLECLGRDRTKHQVAEVTSLGLVQMTRKRIGQGLLEVFSEPCEACNGRGVIVYADPVESKGPKVEQYEPQVVRPGAAASATAKIAAAGKRASDGSSSDAASDAVVADSDSANDGEASDSGRTGRSKRGRSGRRRGRGEDRDESAAGSDSTDEAPPQHSVAGTDSAPEPPTVPDRPTVPDTLATPELLSVPDTAVPAASSARIVTVASDRTDSLAEPVAASAGRPVRGSRRRAASRPAGPAAVDVSASSSEG